MDLLKLTTLLMFISFSTAVAAQVFAPGEMSKVHAHLKSLSKCNRCHSTEHKVDREKCLSCHKTTAARIKQKKGFHGQTDVRAAACDKCHKEHRGPSANLIPWPEGNKKNFDHNKTGWPLQGAHPKLACEKCHDRRLIRDKDVLAHLEENPRAFTQQGLSTKCDACHFNEHRGAVGDKCERCHTETAFKPPSKFDHDTSWRLEGAHKKVECDKCHKKTTDVLLTPKGIPAPKSDSYLLMKPVAHQQCTDCHKDPHSNRFGADCLSCHTMDSWGLDKPPKNAAFHDKTTFPLKGRHRFVPCARCHHKNEKNKTILKPIAHDRCGACHPNAHPDIQDAEMAKKDCTSCHDNNGFKPARFTLEKHQQTPFPLKDAHAAAACPVCHLQKMGPPNPPPKAAHSAKFLSSVVISPWRMRADIQPTDCAKCHKTPHRDQFNDKSCTDCHNGVSWKIPPGSFDHDTKTRYVLKGKHRDVPCEKCHTAKTDGAGSFTAYRPLPREDCASCHKDIHAGQFTTGLPKRPCRDCHNENGFKPHQFDHNDKAQCRFPLRGKHAKIDCARCHPKVFLSEQLSVTRYRPTMPDCDGCHEDVHRGAYADADLLLHKTSRIRSKTAPLTSAEAYPWTVPSSWYRVAQNERTDCTTCHVETGWSTVTFNHSGTKFPLLGMHKKVACDKCHGNNADTTAALLRGCEGCHRDPHRGRLGADCRQCHTEDGFDRTEKMRARHNRTAFPLTGRHAVLPCTECHQDVRDIGFNRTPTDCVACHQNDIPGPGQSQMNHTALSRDCKSCHTTVAFEIADFQGHDRCFPIGTISRHGAVACTKCHEGSLPSPGSNCAGSGFSCTQCHTCLTDKHRNVSGYSCTERRCYECHPNP